MTMKRFAFLLLLLVSAAALAQPAPAAPILIMARSGPVPGQDGGGDPPGQESALCQAGANTLYVGTIATGSGNGADYSNLLAQTFTAVRGKTYCYVDGVYNAKTFSTAASGTTTITLTKATVLNHGTSTGWSDALGDGQTQFPSLYFSTAYWIFDGGKGDGSTSIIGRTDPATYGFYIHPSSGDGVNFGGFSDTSQHVTVARTAVVCAGSAVGSSSGDHQYAYHGWPNFFTLSRSFASNCQVGVWNQGDDLTVEYTSIISGWSLVSPSLHGVHIEVIDRPIVRFNYLQGCPSQCIEPGGGSTTNSSGGVFYGNIIKDAGTVTSQNGFMVGVSSSTFINTLLYNNLMVGGYGAFFTPNRGIGNCASGNVAQNNVLFSVNNGALLDEGCGSPTSHNYNTSYNTSGSIAGEANGENLSGNPFVDSASGNYHLSAGTTAGNALSAPYNTDIEGVTRGIDGTWDRGVYEYQ